MEHSEGDDDFEVFPESAPQISYLKSIGFNCPEFASAAAERELPELKRSNSLLSASRITSTVCRILCSVCGLMKKILIPSLSEHSVELHIIKHSGLLFKENALLIEDFAQTNSQPVSNYFSPHYCIVLPLAYMVFNMKRLHAPSTKVVFGVASIYATSYVYRLYHQFKHRSCVKNLVLAFKQFNQKFLKSLRFIAENDKRMMRNYSSTNQMQISGFNSFKILDPSWSHFKLLLPELTVTILQDLHYLCRDFLELSAVSGHMTYQSVCSLDFTELGISEVETESHQAYLSFLNKLKLLLFLMESELFCFIAINLCDCSLKSSIKISRMFIAMNGFLKKLLRSSNAIEDSFDQIYSSGKEELLLEKNDPLLAHDPDLAKVYYETCALAHSSLSLSILARNLENALEREVLATKRLDKFQILTHVDDMISNIGLELLSTQRQLKSLTKLLTYALKSSGEASHDDNLANAVAVKEMREIEKIEIEVGHSDFNPLQPDEVFVGSSERSDGRHNSGSEDDNDDDNYKSEERLYSLALRQSSKSLIRELKLKLRDKKMEMAEREKIALQRQNLTDLVEGNHLPSSSSENESCDEEQPGNVDTSEENSGKVSSATSSAPQGEVDRITESKQNALSEAYLGDRITLRERLQTDTEETRENVLDWHASLQNDSPNNQESAAASIEADEHRILINTRFDNPVISEQDLHNPLAARVTNISRAWNQQLNRSEEYYGSDSESSSDCEN